MALTQWTAVSNLPVSLATELTPGMLAYRRTGDEQSVPQLLSELARSGRIPAGTAAALHALVGSDEEALEWLRSSVDDRSWIDQYLRVNWAYDGLRGEPGFEEVLDLVGA
jgi:hypothetical protein